MNVILKESKVWLYISVSANIGLDVLPVSVSIVPPSSRPGTWVQASWADPSTARVLIGPGTGLVLDSGVYNVYVQITAQFETPVLLAGSIQVR